MRFLSFLLIGYLSVLLAPRAAAQAVLLEENFNTCELASGWAVSASGNPDHVWYVDLAQNPLILNQSIDGSCMLFVDDNAIGDAPPGYVVSFTSPIFDLTPYTTVECTMDVFFRFGQTDFLQILVTDGVSEVELARFDQYWTNDLNITDGHFSLQHDLALMSLSPETRLIIRYTSPDTSFGKFAAVDNIRVVGSGIGTNVLREAFNDCALPTGWETAVLAGAHDWRFGKVQLGSSAFYDGSSMDGSCFAYFDDSALGDSVQPSTIRLLSPWFVGNAFLEYDLQCDAIMRYSGAESFRIYLFSSGTDSVLLYQSEGKVGGPFFPQYTRLNFDLSAYRSAQWRLMFEYSDGGNWGYWTGVDNIKVTGRWPANEYCGDAITLFTDQPCTATNNRSAVFDGPDPSCVERAVASLWYHWQADFSGVARLHLQSAFNAAVDVFTGSCGALQPVVCNNRDEHGFVGEQTYFEAVAGTDYRIRVSGQEAPFGLPTGSLCIGVEHAPGFPQRPPNDLCEQALSLVINATCTPANNRNAEIAEPPHNYNTLARADAWYTFVAGNLPTGERYEARSNALFSDIITVYAGGCENLEELGSNPFGRRLELPDLLPGQQYHLRISGNFATVEDSICPEIVVKTVVVPLNDTCSLAVPVPIGGLCVQGDNTDATFSGHRPACAVRVGHDIWFSFVAPSSGSVRVNTGADFRHYAAVWRGNCDSLIEVYCARNPQRCEGYMIVGSLEPGATYYLQIASWLDVAGKNMGSVCIKILDGAVPADLQPLQLSAATVCTGIQTATLELSMTGGTPPYTLVGYTPGESLPSGQPFALLATDAAGCERFLSGVVDECPVEVCTLFTQVAAKMFLQGPYVSSVFLMHDSLRTKDLIPLLEPFSGMDNFVHVGSGGGEQTTPAVLAVSGPNAIVDWVFLELRNAQLPTQVIATRAALLQRDGDVVDTDGTSPVVFDEPSAQQYVVVVRHRNHLGVQWGSPVLFPNCEAVPFDFTTMPAAGFYLHNNQNPAQRQIGTRYALWAGNGRIDAQIKYNGSANDRNAIISVVGLTTINNIVPGYRLADYNLDGLVKYNGSANDRNVLLGTVGITTPSVIVEEQVAR